MVIDRRHGAEEAAKSSSRQQEDRVTGPGLNF